MKTPKRTIKAPTGKKPPGGRRTFTGKGAKNQGLGYHGHPNGATTPAKGLGFHGKQPAGAKKATPKPKPTRTTAPKPPKKPRGY